MEHQEGRFEGKGRLSIYRQAWLPEKKDTRAAVVLLHGLGEHSGRYAHVAAGLVAAGIAVYAMDHRGHGQSEGHPVQIDRFANAVADIHTFIEWVKREQRRKPLFLLGHSMGGALALSTVIKHSEGLTGLILSGPAVALTGAPPLIGPISKVLSLIAPKLGLFPVDPALVSRDKAMVAAYANDPLNAHGKVPARTLGEIVKFVDILPALLPVIKLPLLVQHGSEDKLAGVAGSEMLVQRVSSTDVTLKVYPGLYHEIYNELLDDRAVVLADLLSWIQKRIPA